MQNWSKVSHAYNFIVFCFQNNWQIKFEGFYVLNNFKNNIEILIGLKVNIVRQFGFGERLSGTK